MSTTNLTLNEHLTFPSISTEPLEVDVPCPPQPRPVLKDRLYVGNLHPTVDEYTLLQLFSKFGKITKLDFLFHKAGALKGKPRGYAFVEYGDQADALKALTKAHDKLLRGRKLVVTYAHQAPLDQDFATVKHRKAVSEAGRPTALSLIKSGITDKRHARTEDKIALMEAKLRQLEGNKVLPEASSSKSALHPSLPAKPPPPLVRGKGNLTDRMPTEQRCSPNPLPSLPITPTGPSQTCGLGTHPPTSQLRHKPKLAGVKIVRQKDKHA